MAIMYGNPVQAIAEYPSQPLCQGAGEFLTEKEEDKTNNKWWCVPVPTMGAYQPMPQDEEVPQEQEAPKQEGEVPEWEHDS